MGAGMSRPHPSKRAGPEPLALYGGGGVPGVSTPDTCLKTFPARVTVHSKCRGLGTPARTVPFGVICPCAPKNVCPTANGLF